MQIQELINAAHKEATKNTEPLRETALVVFSYRNLIRYTELIIQHTCEQAAKLEGKNLYD
jgi:predicted hydrocarbon binding protein